MSTTSTLTPAQLGQIHRLRDEAGIRYGLAHAGLMVAALFAGATSMPHPASFTLLTVAAIAGGRGLAARWRVGIALAAWAIWTGFFENTLGLLTFSGPDLMRLAALSLLGAGSAHLARRRWDRLGL